jgi:uncharacterized coiled-coil DUF342 family protein
LIENIVAQVSSVSEKRDGKTAKCVQKYERGGETKRQRQSVTADLTTHRTRTFFAVL